MGGGLLPFSSIIVLRLTKISFLGGGGGGGGVWVGGGGGGGGDWALGYNFMEFRDFSDTS